MSLGLQQRYQISERDIPQRLAVYHGTRGGGRRKVADIQVSSCPGAVVGRDIQTYAVR